MSNTAIEVEGTGNNSTEPVNVGSTTTIEDVDTMSEEALDEFISAYSDVPSSPVSTSTESETPADTSVEVSQTSDEVIQDATTDTTETESVEVDTPTEDVVTDDEVASDASDASDASKAILGDYSESELTVMQDVYNSLFKEGIKASGTIRTVRNPEHLKTLVRLGLHSNETNRKMKPYLRTVKSFENAGITLDDDNINYIIDILNGDEVALRNLLKERHRLPEDVISSWYDEEGTSIPYTPTRNYNIDEASITLESNLEALATSPEYTKLTSFLTNEDATGKSLLGSNPELVNLLHADMQSGVFEKALDEAMYRMDRGLLPRQSNLLSYIEVMKDEEFLSTLNPKANAIVKSSTNSSNNEASVVNSTQPTVKASRKKEVNSRKQQATVASSTNYRGNKATPNNSRKTIVDVDNMSEEEFDKFYASLNFDD